MTLAGINLDRIFYLKWLCLTLLSQAWPRHDQNVSWSCADMNYNWNRHLLSLPSPELDLTWYRHVMTWSDLTFIWPWPDRDITRLVVALLQMDGPSPVLPLLWLELEITLIRPWTWPDHFLDHTFKWHCPNLILYWADHLTCHYPVLNLKWPWPWPEIVLQITLNQPNLFDFTFTWPEIVLTLKWHELHTNLEYTEHALTWNIPDLTFTWPDLDWPGLN